jgi:hypothetical protein
MIGFYTLSREGSAASGDSFKISQKLALFGSQNHVERNR